MSLSNKECNERLADIVTRCQPYEDCSDGSYNACLYFYGWDELKRLETISEVAERNTTNNQEVIDESNR